MAENNLGLSVIAGLDRSRSLIQINSDIKRIESQINKLNLQIKLDGNSNAEIQRQISELSRQRRNLYVDLKIRKNDLKRQYKQAVNELQNNPINVKVNTSNAQKQMTGLTNSVRNTKDETFSLANALRKALNNTGYVISSQLALQLVRNAAREATDALKEYDKYATNLSIITNGTRENSNDIIADLSEKSFEFKKPVTINGKVVEGLGQNVKPVTKSEWEKDNKTFKNVGKFAGYDTMKDFLNAIMAGEYTIPTSTANSMMNSNINSRIGKDITKTPDYTNSNINNAPVFNQTFNIDGDATDNTVNKFKNAAREVATEEINSYFQYLNNTMQSTLIKSRYSK